MKIKSSNKINIRPGVSILSVLPHLNYKPWFALAEFVDNSIQSFYDYYDEIVKVEKCDFKLRVDIEIDLLDEGRIIIRDNAAGIHEKDFARAFRPAEIPPDRSGLCEFGMGMKSASCWFSPIWTVRTSALGEPYEKTVQFDIEKIVSDEIEELDVIIKTVDANLHYTTITLENLYRKPQGRTISKIKDHLRDIYRVFTREKKLQLFFYNEPIQYINPEILIAPYYKNLKGKSIEWRKEINFDFGLGLKAYGFAAIRKKASTSEAGFALFRRNRLIQGSADEGYRPEYIFGKPNSFIFQRVFGEIHLEGFEVSHTKDGFQWDENEVTFLALLKESLGTEEFPLLQQAREYRVDRKPSDYQKGAQAAVLRTARAIEENAPQVMEALVNDKDKVIILPEELETNTQVTEKSIDIELSGNKWTIIIELTHDPSVGDWLQISDQSSSSNLGESRGRKISLRLSLSHPFMERFSGPDCDEIEPILRIAAALGLSEVIARESGVRKAGTIRRNVNELLRNALWQT
ncbi:MAG: ATP-binding protein [Spirochaetae bacterium HGW-Spirochaetae-1]|jgi:hypothetical protein|nr:MAG: ATP-binding protein [Spirochaetae bacterium HGW-Spirochaetae-1]